MESICQSHRFPGFKLFGDSLVNRLIPQFKLKVVPRFLEESRWEMWLLHWSIGDHLSLEHCSAFWSTEHVPNFPKDTCFRKFQLNVTESNFLSIITILVLFLFGGLPLVGLKSTSKGRRGPGYPQPHVLYSWYFFLTSVKLKLGIWSSNFICFQLEKSSFLKNLDLASK